VQLTASVAIDDVGRIVTEGVLPDGNQHVFLLEPTGQSLANATARRPGGHRSGVQAMLSPIRGRGLSR
jgi:hypothetical protein